MARNEREEVVWARQALFLKYIELDLRKFISKTYSASFNTSLMFIPSAEARDNAFHSLLKKDPDVKVNQQDIATRILDHLYPMDLISIIRHNQGYAEPEENKHINKHHEKFEKFLGTGRNEVFHFRDYDMEEFVDFVREISNESAIWIQLRERTNELLSMSYDDLKEDKNELLEKKTHTRIFNELLYCKNLPEEDYLDWGFTGRRVITEKIHRALFTDNHNAVMLYGPGGIGKTSIARNICEKQLDKTNVNFIWWHSSKARSYAQNKIKAHGKDVVNLVDIEKLIYETTNFSLNELKEEEQYKPLFVLDNMENQNEDEVTRIVNKFSGVGKVIITGRNALPNIGAFPLQVGSLTDKESDMFLRRVARYYGQQEILEAEVKTASIWMAKLGNSPLFIRSFVEAIKAGKSPVEYFKGFDDYDELINFVFFNVTDNFSEDAKTLISTLDVDKTSLSSALIGEVTGWDSERVTEAVSIIRRSPLIERINKSNLDHYKLTDLAKKYVKKHMRFSRAREDLEKDKILTNLKLRDEFQQRKIVSSVSDTSYFVTYDEQEHLSGYQLNQALLERNIDDRIKLIEDLDNKWPDFSPIKLNLALLYKEKDLTSQAQEEFQLAIECSNEKLNREKAYFQYINFLIEIKEFREAKELFPEIETVGSLEVKILGLKLNLDPTIPGTFDDFYKLYDLIRLPSEKKLLTLEILKIEVKQASLLISSHNFSDAKMYLDDFLVALEGKFVEEYFGDDAVNYFINSFLEIYFIIYLELMNKSSTSIEELTRCLEKRDFLFASEHYEFIYKLTQNQPNIIVKNFIESLKLEDEYQLFLVQKDVVKNKEKEKRGTVMKLTPTDNADMGTIKNELGELFIFYASHLVDVAYGELEEGDQVKWNETIRHVGKNQLNEASHIIKLD